MPNDPLPSLNPPPTRLSAPGRRHFSDRDKLRILKA
jgi:hypothetical protein